MECTEITDLTQLTGATAADTLERSSVLSGGGMIVVRPGGIADRATIVEAAATLREAPAVTVVVGIPDTVDATLAGAADVCLVEAATDAASLARPWVHASLDELTTAVAAAPHASLGLVALLRSTETVDVRSAIAAEAATYGLLLGSEHHRRWLAERDDTGPRSQDRPAVAVSREGGRLDVLLDRPDARNAFDTATRDALVEALGLPLVDETIREVHLSGAGPTFSAGGDLREFGTTTDPVTTFAVRLTRHPGWALHRVSGLVHAHLHGPCVGAGVEVPAFAAHVSATPDTTFLLPEVSMGVVPGAGGTVSVPRRIGRHRAAWLSLTGATVDATTALAWGLIDEVASVP